jgi:hypothetical protein
MQTLDKGGGVSSENTWDCSQTLFFLRVNRAFSKVVKHV